MIDAAGEGLPADRRPRAQRVRDRLDPGRDADPQGRVPDRRRPGRSCRRTSRSCCTARPASASAEALAVLKGAGFSDAVHVGGGVIAWVNQIEPSQALLLSPGAEGAGPLQARQRRASRASTGSQNVARRKTRTADTAVTPSSPAAVSPAASAVSTAPIRRGSAPPNRPRSRRDRRSHRLPLEVAAEGMHRCDQRSAVTRIEQDRPGDADRELCPGAGRERTAAAAPADPARWPA